MALDMLLRGGESGAVLGDRCVFWTAALACGRADTEPLCG